jgi:hypothetical protein
MTENFADILNQSWDDLPEPAPYLPNGTWLLKGRNIAYFDADPDKEDSSARVVMFFEPVEPMDDVDQEKLDELGPNYDFANNDVVKQVYINRAKDWVDVRKILELAHVPTEGRTQADTFKDFRNAKVLAYLNVRTFKNKRTGETVMQNDPTNFAEVE